MVIGQTYGLATCGLHNSPPPSSDKVHPDVSQPPQGSVIGSPRNRCPPHGHPIRMRLVDELDRARVEVYRLHDAALLGGPSVVRNPPKERPPKIFCAYHDAFSYLVVKLFWHSSPARHHRANGLCSSTKVCSAPQIIMKSSCSTTYTVRTVRYGIVGS
jgi:hypothetical protein